MNWMVCFRKIFLLMTFVAFVFPSRAWSAGPTIGSSFIGLGVGFPGVTYDLTAPSDVNISVSPEEVVQVVNYPGTYMAWDKQGNQQFSSPQGARSLWYYFDPNSLCYRNAATDSIVKWDQLTERWLIVTMTGADPSGNADICLAIARRGGKIPPSDSTARSDWTLYTILLPTGNEPDYIKLGNWGDAWYLAADQYAASDGSFRGAYVCALNKKRILSGGQEAPYVCFTVPLNNHGSFLPADLDGPTPPPNGEPEWFVNLNGHGLNGEKDQKLQYWKFYTDFDHPENASFTGPTNVSRLKHYQPSCINEPGFNACAAQPDPVPGGNKTDLETLSDRLMNRLSYRNGIDGEHLYVTHTVRVNLTHPVAIRWYEIQVVGGTLSVKQQGNYAPDGSARFFGSIASDSKGNIGLGFAESSKSLYPSLAVSGRLVSDPPGKFLQGEDIVVRGVASSNNSRWGDYFGNAVDPSDDCTFWFTGQWQGNTTASDYYNWSTWITAFKWPSCR